MNAQPMSTSEQTWLSVRDHLRQHRFELSAAAAAALPNVKKLADTPLLTRSEWIPRAPLALDSIDIQFAGDTDEQFPALLEAVRAGLPTRLNGARFESYAEAIGELARPSVFENRTTYRLLEADLISDRPMMRFGRGTYFDGVDTGEAAAHEFAATHMGAASGSRIRDAVTDPCDLLARPANLAISTLTVRRDTTDGHDTFLLHWRDPAKVGHAGGMFQVVPVGVFQPSGEAVWNWHNDFSLWRSVIRELAEELAGQSEDHGSEIAPIDYQSWDVAARLDQGVREGAVQRYCLGLGVDPLSWATDLLTAVVVDAPLFDELFGRAVGDNAEGRVLDTKPFTPDELADTVSRFRLQAAGAATLRLAAQVRVVQP